MLSAEDPELQAAWFQLTEAVRTCVSPCADVASTECLPLYTLVYSLCSPTAAPGGEPAPQSRAPLLYAHLRTLLFLHARASALVLAHALFPVSVPHERHPLFTAGCPPDLDPARVEHEAGRMQGAIPRGLSPLDVYSRLWSSFDAGIHRVAAVFWHLDKDYIGQNAGSCQVISEIVDPLEPHEKTSSIPVYGVRSTALIAWRDEVIAFVGPVLLDRALRIAASERRARLRNQSSNQCSKETLGLIRVLLESVVTVGSTALLHVYDESSSACSDSSSGDRDTKPISSELRNVSLSSLGCIPTPSLSVGSQSAYEGLPDASRPPDPLRLTEEQRAPCVLLFYRKLFEVQFLEDVELFYQQQSVYMLEENNVPVRKYVQEMATSQLDNELRFCSQFVHKSTMKPLRVTLEHELIAEHRVRLLDAANNLLADACKTSLDILQARGVIDDLHDLYRLLVCVKNGVRPLQNQLRRHAAQAGMYKLREFALHTGNLDDLLAASAHGPARATPAAKFVRGAWTVLHRFQTITDVCFERNGGCQNALNQACEQFMNSFDAAPQLLAQFAHEVLEDSAALAPPPPPPRLCGDAPPPPPAAQYLPQPLSDGEAEEWVEHTTRLFRYLSEKDVFQRVYAVRLTRRLINATSRGIAAEHFMLAQLAELCGPDYTSRLKRMFADVDASRASTDAFRAALGPRADATFELDVLVLSATAWPVTGGDGGGGGGNGGDGGGCVGLVGFGGAAGAGDEGEAAPGAQAAAAAFVALPGRIGVGCAQFIQHYAERQGYTRRRVTWMYHLCRVGLRARVGRVGRRRVHELEVSLVQAAVLLQFNDQARASADALAGTLGIPVAAVRAAVALLVRVRVLTPCAGAAAAAAAPLDGATLVEVNDSATAPPVRGALRVALLAPDRPQHREADTSKRYVEQDRRTQIQACVVRKMKEAKVLQENDLFRRVVDELRRWFPVKHADIVRNVETLIENEYIARDGTVYSYVA